MAVNPKGEFKEVSLSDYKGKYVILYFYPLDFTFVCTSEIVAFSKMQEEFEKKGAVLLGVSVDSQFTHKAWISTPKTEGGIEGLSHLLLSDLNKTISTDYDVLLDDPKVAVRGVFVIDKEGTVQAELRNNLALGRNVDEVMRILEALIHAEDTGKVMPANWVPGKAAMEPTTEGVKEYMSKHVE